MHEGEDYATIQNSYVFENFSYWTDEKKITYNTLRDICIRSSLIKENLVPGTYYLNEACLVFNI